MLQRLEDENSLRRKLSIPHLDFDAGDLLTMRAN